MTSTDHNGKILKPGDMGTVAPSYQSILDSDSGLVDPSLRQEGVDFTGGEFVSAKRYTDPNFFTQEVDKLWPRCWQFACREEDLAESGDVVVYDIAKYSILVVRGESGDIKAFHNVCRHRGRKLRTHNGNAKELRCPFHGFEWDLDGKFTGCPTPWDFPKLDDCNSGLVEIKVQTWQGYVFINLNSEADDLMSVLGVLPDHLARFDHANRRKIVHVSKVVGANWKVVAEAFMESWHTPYTHPQLMPFLGDINSQYDVYSDHISRQISAQAVASPFLTEALPEQKIVDILSGVSSRLGGDGDNTLPEGVSAREFLASKKRNALSEQFGIDLSEASDADMLDAVLYNVAPNMCIWAGHVPNIVYRWRPLGLDVDRCIMDVMILSPLEPNSEPYKKVPVTHLKEEQSWKDAPQLGGLGGVFDQDEGNLRHVQEGLKASPDQQVHFSSYQEVRLRQLHITLDKYLK